MHIGSLQTGPQWQIQYVYNGQVIQVLLYNDMFVVM